MLWNLKEFNRNNSKCPEFRELNIKLKGLFMLVFLSFKKPFALITNKSLVVDQPVSLHLKDNEELQ